MKKGLTWENFHELAVQAEAAKNDYEVYTDKIQAVPHFQSGVGLRFNDQEWRLSDVAHEQLAGMVKIPRQYYWRMLHDHPGKLAELVDMHLRRDKVPAERFVRTIGNKVRALLSTRYGVLDHIDVARMLQDTINRNGTELKSLICTERRLTFQFVTPRLQGEVKVGDIVQGGLAITNSEVGLGMFRVNALLYRLACLNGMITPAGKGWKLEKVHLGEIDLGILQEFTRDRINALPQEFENILELTRNADGVYVAEENIPREVDAVRRRHALSLPEAEAVLEDFYEEGRWTLYGLSNAVNFQAHKADNDRSVELERISGDMLDHYF